MGSTLKVLPIQQKIVLYVRQCKQGELFFGFIILSKPVHMHLTFSGTLTSSISLILKDILMYLIHFINVAEKPIILCQDLSC